MLEAETPSIRLFNISKKTPHSDMLNRGYTSDFTNQITRDIITNAYEVEPQVDWDTIIGTASSSWEFNSFRSAGADAIRNSYAKTIVSIAKAMELDMHSPPIVYMSVCSLLKPLKARITELRTEGKNNEELEELSSFYKKIADSAEAYARKFLIGDERYKKVLQMLISPGNYFTVHSRKKAIEFLNESNIGKAHSALTKDIDIE